MIIPITSIPKITSAIVIDFAASKFYKHYWLSTY